ncbi:hypothetical protein AB0442_37215 [Kitasatospora sp. NPDC085895]|uniref:hypothetical protein n=1 Tax=Kitasatospora sp. NPDC085895 TaxID=3155057 RepID=UPI0034507345
MRHRLPAIALTAALAGGVLLAAAPAQAAPVQPGAASAVAATDHRADVVRMLHQRDELLDEAMRLDQLGDHKAANDKRYLAALLQRMIDTILASEQHG